MTGGGFLSGGVVFAIAAALWILYLLPTWRRRSEFLATERNAVRLQQTLRILAETAEVPQEIRIEANARAVAEQQRVLKKHRAEQAALAKAEADALARSLKAHAPKRSPEVTGALRARARRRLRLATTLVLTAALAAGAWGGAQLATTGAWFTLAAAGLTVVLCVGLLARMARTAARAAAPAGVAVPRSSVPAVAAPLVEYEIGSASSTWTPVPLPKPLHLAQGSTAASVIAEADAHERLRAAALAEAMAQRAADLAPPVTRLPQRPAAERTEPLTDVRPAAAGETRQPTEESRFARMGVIDDAEISAPSAGDLLRRRRLAG